MSGPIRLPRPRLLTDDQLTRICETGMEILARHGLMVMHAPALEAAGRAGLRVQGDRVFPERSDIGAFLAEERAGGRPAPTEAGEKTDLTLNISGYASHILDLDTDELLPCTEPLLIESCKLIDSLAAESVVGGAPGYPTEVHHLLQPLLKYKIQAQHCRHGGEPVDHMWPPTLPYVMEMAEALGHPIRSLPVYVVSPLAIGAESLESVMSAAHKLERVSASNMPSVGATTPIRIGHALALGLAEVAGAAMVLRAITGLPVGWSVWSMAFDMRGMSLALGAPEQRLFMWASEELNAFCRGREPGIPWGWGSMYTEAKTPGVQAAAEKMAGAMVYALLGARDLDGGGELKNIFSPEQLVIDCEIRDYVARLTAGVNGDCDPETCFAEIVAGIGHGFMGVDSTLDSYRDVYWFPRLFERRPVAAWIEAKGPDLRARAKSIAREFIAKYDYALADDISKEVNRIYADATKHLAVWPDDRRMA